MAAWMEQATESMLAMAGVSPGARVLDLACGAGNQTLLAARRVESPEDVRAAAWAEVGEFLKTMETADGFVAPAEVMVIAGSKPA